MASVRYIVDDVEACIRFYCGRLGFELEQQFGPAWRSLPGMTFRSGLPVRAHPHRHHRAFDVSHRLRSLAIVVAAVSCAVVSAAEDGDLRLAKERIGLTAAQMPSFNEMVHRLDRNIGDAVTAERRKIHEYPPEDIQRRISDRVKRLYRKLDEPAREILRADQWKAFKAFKKAHYKDVRRRKFEKIW